METFFFLKSETARLYSIWFLNLALPEEYTEAILHASLCYTVACHDCVRLLEDSSTSSSCGPDQAWDFCCGQS